VTGTGTAPDGRSASSLVVTPQRRGPRIRLGVLWFLVALAAVTSGRWFTAVLWAAVAFVAAGQVTRAWSSEEAQVARGAGVLSGIGAAVITLAAAWSTGLAGVVVTSLALTAAVAIAVGRPPRRQVAPVVIGMFLPAVASASVVLAVRVNLWLGLFLVLLVSLYDAGYFVFGADSSGRWEGLAGGLVGALAVTFTMSALQSPPFDTATAWLTGAMGAVACILGQVLVSAFLPRPDDPARAMRRLDTYVVTAPVFVAAGWLLGS
jgi:hypothetical protein